MRAALRPSAAIAAFALAATTLGVFGVLYDYGPGSAIRQFHQALATDNEAELRRLIVPPRNPILARQMLQELDEFVRNGDIRIEATQRFDREVRTIVSYRGNDGLRFPVVFVVVKPDRQWQIDLEKTATIVRDMLRMSR
ncbi:hypothetical protein EON81_06085 [bacterium]|nr:MAG: hypothetical protein EON81_06085 [bacterium]